MQNAEQIIRTWFSEAWNKGNIDQVYPELVHHDAEFHSVGQDGGKLVGLAGFRTLYDPVRAAFSDINFVVQDVVAAGDAAAVRWTCTGKHSGDQMGFAPSGKTVAFSGIAIVHFKDGKVSDSWDEWDRLGFMTQIGALPSK
jgi:steroid delta-isomerase-like uncharacterized protein